MNIFHTLALDYVAAIYPLVLMVVIYLCIEMFERRFRAVVGVLKPFCRCFKGKGNPKGSVIAGFSTFLLLSYSKLLALSYSLLNTSVDSTFLLLFLP